MTSVCVSCLPADQAFLPETAHPLPSSFTRPSSFPLEPLGSTPLTNLSQSLYLESMLARILAILVYSLGYCSGYEFWTAPPKTMQPILMVFSPMCPFPHLSFILFLFLLKVLLCSCGQPRIWYIDQGGLIFREIYLPQLPVCFFNLYPVLFCFLNKLSPSYKSRYDNFPVSFHAHVQSTNSFSGGFPLFPASSAAFSLNSLFNLVKVFLHPHRFTHCCQ